MSKYKINITTNKYLFLDIDGVLNSFDDYGVDGKEFIENIENLTFILSKRQMSLLNNIIDKYHPKIILSSYWRNRYSLLTLQNKFEAAGFKGKILAITPSFGGEHEDRWQQIKHYIEDNDVSNYIILDDSPLDRKNTKFPNWVKTDSYHGLDHKHLREIDKIWQK
jgi:hypothetical protein